MEGVISPSMMQSGHKSSVLSPLLISMLGIVVTTMAILAYHLLLVKYCARRSAANAAAARPAEAEPRLPTGVDEKVLAAIPILAFAAVKRGTDQEECVVCLGELEDGDAVRLLPSCKHAFHVPCIDKWLADTCLEENEMQPASPERVETATFETTGEVEEKDDDSGRSGRPKRRGQGPRKYDDYILYR